MDLFHLIFAVFLEFFEFKIFAKWQNLQKNNAQVVRNMAYSSWLGCAVGIPYKP